jgi:lipopolysaccharide/colanic/teichoic acid biosynthesis glycosyltransferase
MSFYRRIGKRALDVAIAGLALFVLSPLLLLTALAIKLTSRGPVFYVQARIGRFGRPFPFIKFRSMVQNAERQGAGILCLQADPRVTAVGRVLRRTSFDELPQLFNVLRGEMSVIGPRPGLAYQVEQYTPWQRRRLEILPGITGWAQVNGRNSITWDQRIAFDVEYVDKVSLAKDLQVLMRTARAMASRGEMIAQKDFFKEQRKEKDGAVESA